MDDSISVDVSNQLKDVFDSLDAFGVQVAVVSFKCEEEDEGEIELVGYFDGPDADAAKVEPTHPDDDDDYEDYDEDDLKDDVVETTEDLLNDVVMEWDQDDGSEGRVVLDATTRTATVHYTRYRMVREKLPTEIGAFTVPE